MSRRKTEPETLGLHPAAKPDDTHLLLWRLKTDLQNCTDKGVGLSLGGGLGMLVCAAVVLIYTGAVGLNSKIVALAGFTGVILVSMSFIVATGRNESRRAKLRNQIADVDDVRALPLLLDEALRNAKYVTPPDARRRVALLRLLPRVGPQDRGLLNSRQRTALYKWLGTTDADFAGAILSALRHVAAVDAVPHLRPLADGKGLARKNDGIRKAAREVLAGLEQRLTVQAQPTELLRGASEPEQPATALLRPAHSAHEAPPDELPRASVRPT